MGATWCDGFTGPYCSPTDISHAEDFVFVAIELYRAGIVFNKTDIENFIYIYLNYIWDKNVTDPRFYSYIDGNLRSSSFVRGRSALRGGWADLGAFNYEIYNLVETGGDSFYSPNPEWDGYFTHYAELARNLAAKN